jgi:hypothetical protein
MSNNFYTYAYLNDQSKPYYIGKGHGKRAYGNHANVLVPSEDKILFLKRGLTEEQALQHESYMIYVLGKQVNCSGVLQNKLDKGITNSIQYPKEDVDYWTNDLLCSIFGNKTVTCILLFIHKEEEAHAQRIAKTFSFGLNQTQRQLKRLETNYILTSKKIGNVRLYSFNTRNSTVKNLRKFLDTCLSSLNM